ncbi:hypothetical protein [Mycobacteroides abscessus]|uniref:hypothetical protein n=1 Tax=Mycobacteroides abscessus TaxID=36809 RepID=UPI0012FFFB8B
MSNHYFNICRANIGRGVCINTCDGGVYRGVIANVTATHVCIVPIRGRGGYAAPVSEKLANDEQIKLRNLVSTAKGSDKNKELIPVQWGYGYDDGWWIALATIGALAFLPFFW